MKTLLRLASVLLLSAVAIAQGVPVCNGFNAGGQPIDTATNSTNCTDYFGVGNYANSPVPAGVISGFTLIASGIGYVNPQVVIMDPSGNGATAVAVLDPTGAVIDVTVSTSGTGYTMPQVNIVDVGAGGVLGAPTCGSATGQVPCGSGALATAILGGPFTGGMLKFQDALPDLKGAIAVADTTTFPGSDFYVIGLVQYSATLHASLPPTTLRGYCQLANAGSTTCNTGPFYLGPVILAQKNRPVRVLFKNMLPAGTGGNLFIPVDTTYMGATLPENRATLHLHGGATPWISDGTPHQWTTPIGDPLMRGASTQFVPDMFFDSTGNLVSLQQCSATVTTNCWPNAVPSGVSNDPGPGAMTFFWTNQQGGRLMFYHDHSYGTTRLNVYAGEAAGYLLADPAEENMLAAASAPGTLGTAADLTHLIPLVIQDKTFVPSAAQIAAQDPTWTAGKFGTAPGSVNTGDLWFPHVYTPNQDPSDPGGSNAFGRWDYGPWFFPPQSTLTAANPPTNITSACTSTAFPGQTLQSSTACPSCGCPITPNPSGTPESFMDTPVVNGKAYPVLHVAPAAYRFQILSAGNDRSWNLSWFIADPTQNNAEVAMLPAVPPATGTALPLCKSITSLAIPSLDMGLANGLLDSTGNVLNGTGLPAGCWPNYGAQVGIPKAQTMWVADGRNGGAPDPRTAGPAWIQIGTEGGLLPAPVVIPATPVNFEYNPRSVTVTNVAAHGLWLGPAERADVIVDFSKFAGQTLILYNDAPTPAPGYDSRLDYFTGNGDQTPIGGAPSTQPGYGPNTRTIMQVVVDGTNPNAVPFSLPALKAAFATTASGPGIFAATQPTTIIPEAAYNSAYNSAFPNSYASIQANSISFTPIAPLNFDQPGCAANPPMQCGLLDQKAIQELFTLDYGRMNATLGTELPFTNFQTQTTIPLAYVDPPTEIIRQGDTQLWKITHNGVDTHFIHFHLFNVQVVNRMGWDGTIRPPDANELGWKDTVRMNPLEDILVALQPITPILPFPIPDSIRLLDTTMPTGATGGGFSNIDPFTGNPVTTHNDPTNFGWEYVWHCHILGHEENDMMRPIVFQVPPQAPANLALVANPWATGGNPVSLYWTDMSASVSQPGGGFNLKIASDAGFTQILASSVVTSSTGFGSVVSYPFTPVAGVTTYYYEVQAFTPNGISAWVTGSGPIQPALTTTNISTNSPITYGQIGLVTVTVSSPQGIPTGNVTLSVDGGVAASQGLPGVTPDSTVFSLTGLSVGTHTLVATYPDLANPLITTSTGLGSIVVNPAVLTITASSATVQYGGAVPAITASFAGFVNSDTSANLTTQPTCSTTYTQASPVSGSPYTTNCTGAVDPNYAIAYVNGSISVTGAPLTVTASSATVAYGSPVPIIAASFAGFVNGDTSASLTTQPTCTTTYTPASSVGGSPYPTSCAGAVDPNYTIAYVGGSVTVTAVPLTITASSATLAYGSPAPSITASFAGFVNGDTSASLTTQPTCTTTYTATSSVSGSPYPTSCSGAVDPNYTIGYVNGAISVTAVPLMITASSTAMTYGGAVPAITPIFSGFIGGQNSSVLTTQPVCSTTATATTNVGSYPSSCTGAAAANYTITYVPGTVSVGATALAITAGSGTMTYGGAVPPILPSFAGFVNGQNSSVLTSQPVCSTTATSTSPVGSYPSTCAGAAASNYLISYVAGTVTVSKAASVTVISAHTPNPSNVNQAVIVTAGVTPQFSGVPTGTVTISASTGESCGGTLSGSVASCTLTFTTPGARMLTAVYVGDGNFSGSTSAGVSQNVVALGLSVNPTLLAFPNTNLNTNSATQTVTLTNTGARQTTLSYSLTDPAYARVAVTNNCGTTLNTNASCIIAVRFRPTTAGAHTATLNVNAGGVTVATVSLTGTGVAPVAALGPLSPTPLVATRGSSTGGTVSLSNTGTGALTITGITIGGTNANQFSQTNNCGTSLAAGANCTITVTFHPPAGTARGTKNATLRVRDNSNGVTNTLQTTALQGVAQ